MGTFEIVAIVLIAVLGLAIGVGAIQLMARREPPPREDLIAASRTERDERLRAARSQALELRAEAEATARQQLTTLEELEQRLARREERLDHRLDSLTGREGAIAAREATQDARATAIEEAYTEQTAAIERIRALTQDQARGVLLEQVAPSVRDAAALRAETALREAEVAFALTRARPAALAVQRSSSELVGEFALVPVPIPKEEIKGRIIGREGRNIKAFEAMTGVELVIDDAPDVVTLSGFDPFRREIARRALLDLIEDGRIHPGRIEEAVKRAREVLERQLREAGQKAAEAAGSSPVSVEIADLLGKLSLIRGEAEDALETSIRLASVTGAMAAELRADVRTARRAALLSDVGRAVGPEAGGSLSEITADVLARSGESPAVIAALRPPGDLFPAVTAEQASIWLARAIVEAGWLARDESPVRRVDAVERAAALVDGVAEPLAFQVGTRVRLLVRPSEPLDTVGRVELARAVLDRIDSSLGPRVGLTFALLVRSGRHRGEAGTGNGTARVEGGRLSHRGRSHHRRSS
ncbi:MAG: DUF3552 domain-containing protein [Chloroflexi bacterium]|nr:DUF3552 domain-containing protein [Chloroflexota bacterium]